MKMKRHRSYSCGARPPNDLFPIKTNPSSPFINHIGELNRFCSDNKFSRPTYTEIPVFGFACKFSEFQTKGFGSTDSSAKHDAAKKMLLLIKDKHISMPSDGISITDEAINTTLKQSVLNSTETPDPFINYVGKINEWCFRFKHLQPIYTEIRKTPNSGFRTICRFLEFQTQGVGSSKKAAKQDAAKRMFSLINLDMASKEDERNIKTQDLGLDELMDQQVINKQNTELLLMNNFDEECSDQTDAPTTMNPSLLSINHIGMPQLSTTECDAAKKMALIKNQPNASIGDNNNLGQFNGTTVQNCQSIPYANGTAAPLMNYIGKLNEVCSAQKYPPPIYSEVSEAINSGFVMTCRLLEHQTQGSGTSKKAAKQEAAKNMLELIRNKNKTPSVSQPTRKTDVLSSDKFMDIEIKKEEIISSLNSSDIFEEAPVHNDTSVGLFVNKTNPPGFINHVGKLNEFCSGKKLPPARYTDASLLRDSQFGITCTLLKFQTNGFGLSKKDAKQEAARQMLILVANIGHTSAAPAQISPQIEARIIKTEIEEAPLPNIIVE